ncbi:methionine ABC transporter ATP-binding protein [Eleftheria terrae]|uniref:methionine ABC transporter ATP-binding protein n=1 Tax=Eleftheria terrae TaxID=1597781 RepID=UPI00263ABB95|nr:ATP-binding cassette domain-containing protein [Eleftheria terrae]WKB52763.1 ATP-binding cassette domain-containing protein [Eleftheria terrae]
MIRIENLSKTFQTPAAPVTVLKDVNLSIAEGEVFGIIGRSGAGKSTLVRTLNLLERPTAGHVHIDGEDITAFDATRLQGLRQRVGMVFQHFNLLSAKTVAENLRFPLKLAGVHDKAAMDARVDELLQLVGLGEHRNKYPAQLSGGQKQRVGIARALANHPKVLLCDEATSALDPETTQSILRLLLDINRKLGLTIVLITHEMDVIRTVCDRVAVLERGEVVEVGDVADVFLFPKHPVTRLLVSESGAAVDLRDIADELPGHAAGTLWRLTLLDDTATRPVLSDIAIESGLRLNVLRGSIGHIKGRPYGQIVVGLPDAATGDTLRSALQRHEIRHEVLA